MKGRVAVLVAIAVGVAAGVLADRAGAIVGRDRRARHVGRRRSDGRGAGEREARGFDDHGHRRERRAGPLSFPFRQVAAGRLYPSDSSGGLRPGRASERGGQDRRDHDGRSETDTRSRSRVATLQLGVARQLSGHRAGEGLHPRVRALPHAGAGRAIPPRRRRVDEGHRADGDVSAAVVSDEDSEARRGAHRRRRGSARTTAGGMAAAGAVSEHGQLEQGRSLELCAQDAPASERPGDEGDLHRIRPAAAHAGSRTT